MKPDQVNVVSVWLVFVLTLMHYKSVQKVKYVLFDEHNVT